VQQGLKGEEEEKAGGGKYRSTDHLSHEGEGEEKSGLERRMEEKGEKRSP